jgi:hypothetical protein
MTSLHSLQNLAKTTKGRVQCAAEVTDKSKRTKPGTCLSQNDGRELYMLAPNRTVHL